ncbi:MAG: sigma factor [Actinomycetes bacterium]
MGGLHGRRGRLRAAAADAAGRRGHALLRTAYLLTGDQHLAEDLVQTALEKAASHWGSIRVAAAAEAYVRRTMYREQVSI